MNIFETVKSAIPVRQAAEYYGLQICKNNMTCCLFHPDKHPSMKLNDDYFYCFGCGATGDVIDLTARLFDLGKYEAAKKLASDFGIDPDNPPAAAALAKPKHKMIRAFREDEQYCFRVICDYLHLLESWQKLYAPHTPDEPLDDCFVEACQVKDYIEYLADILTVGDLEHTLVMVDDDMKLEALPQTNTIKAIITAELPMDLEKKGRQSYQGDLYVRFMALSNGTLQSLYDRSVGFFRRQIILTAREKDPNRKDDPYLAEKMCSEAEGIFLWALEGLHRLIANDYRFTVSKEAQENLEAAISDGNNVIDFLGSEGYIRFKADYEVSFRDLYSVYRQWCDDNAVSALAQKSFCSYLKQNESRYGLEYTNKVNIGGGRFARGFIGIELISRPY